MNLEMNLPALVVVFPFFSAMLMVAIGVFYKEIVQIMFQVTALITAYLSILLFLKVYESGPIRYFFGNWAPPVGIEYYVDYTNIFFITIITVLLFIMSIYFPKSVKKEIPESKQYIFYSVTMLFASGLLGITITGDLFNIYVFTEISSITAYALIAIGGTKKSYRASFNYLILGTIGATFIVLGIGYLYMATGTLNLLDMQQRLMPMYSSKVVIVGSAFIVVGLSMKMALFPLHTWLPGAYTHSPSTISAFMSATSTKVMAYLLIRFFYTILTPNFVAKTIPLTEVLFYISLIAILAGSFLALGQKDLKMMFAYSSVGQIGYIVFGATLVSTYGLIGSMYHFLSHAVVKGGLFLVAGIIFYFTTCTKIENLDGLYKRMPFTSFAFLIFALSMIGIPVTSGFISKWYLVLGAINSGKWLGVIVILISSLLTAVYFWRIVDRIFFTNSDNKVNRIKEPLSMLIPTYTLVAITIYFGIFPAKLVKYTEIAANLLMETIK
ncbi:monovalent cation/H+ antiporter subunit D family protein [Deferribacterales bacterium Es71-Z0220]|jgi:multicomponent Na+:H+ antiporter subunit D|uniref:monovalent cation/H+ antiporter subunit D family protein n=1 Tax=Deferrivibrio essentukiensis TaxID=2880922 RepID=UPI001F60A2F5|nr:monovalent cation/H+ antiporter subunit D family protein [Deferrivibrio essentukiensis]MBZ4671865.1 NADH/Ubiquinone/plastoquinone [Deferribacteraceae bacterium]MCB4203783.1 monovalent cation/H+ antiporter subunit D family protein [Deferrivibrio essentukiensis]